VKSITALTVRSSCTRKSGFPTFKSEVSGGTPPEVGISTQKVVRTRRREGCCVTRNRSREWCHTPVEKRKILLPSTTGMHHKGHSLPCYASPRLVSVPAWWRTAGNSPLCVQKLITTSFHLVNIMFG